MAIYIWVNIGSGNDLLPDGTKPFLEPGWLGINEVLRHLPKGSFIENVWDVYLFYKFED